MECGICNRQVSTGNRSLVVNKDGFTRALEYTVVEVDFLCAIGPDVVGIGTGLLECTAIEGLRRSIQEHLTIEYAVVIHHRVGMLETDIVVVRLIFKGHALECDLCAVQRYPSGHIKLDIYTGRRLNGNGLAGVS